MFGTDQFMWPKLMAYSLGIIQNPDYRVMGFSVAFSNSSQEFTNFMKAAVHRIQVPRPRSRSSFLGLTDARFFEKIGTKEEQRGQQKSKTRKGRILKGGLTF